MTGPCRARGRRDQRRDAGASAPGVPHLDLPSVALTIGIAGLPNVGKSTLFNALTRATVLAANYPFATIEPNIGIVPLPDPRLARLAEIFGSERQVPATVSFVDIAGIVRGASEGEGLGNQFLANIREADAICQVTRAFADPDVVHVDGKVDPASDIETITTELVLADIQTLEKAIPRLEKEVRAWTIHVGDTAPQAAGVIHTDFERGFIRAQTIAFDDFIAHKGEQGAKEAGKLRAEGKEYVVKDGDVLNFLFNV